MDQNKVVAVHNVSTTYRVPLLLENQNLLETISGILQLDNVQKPPEVVNQGKLIWKEWVELATSQDHIFETVSIALVGKYTSLHDAYMSVMKSLEHAAMHCKKKLNLVWVDSSHLDDAAQESSQAEYHKAWHDVCTADGILVPGGFGVRGTEGMIKATTYARTKNVPFLGICLGMQLAVTEYARKVCGIPGAGSEELHPQCDNPVIVYMPEVSCQHCSPKTNSSPPTASDLTMYMCRSTNSNWAEPCAWASVAASSRMVQHRGPNSAHSTAPRRRSRSAIDTGTKSRRT